MCVCVCILRTAFELICQYGVRILHHLGIVLHSGGGIATWRNSEVLGRQMGKLACWKAAAEKVPRWRVLRSHHLKDQLPPNKYLVIPAGVSGKYRATW